MKRLICTVGFPRSGKSTWARELAQDRGYTIVCPDEVRLAVHGQRYWAPGEKLVWATVHIMVKALFAAGNNTIIMDATNTTRAQRDQWCSDEWETVFHCIDTPADECCRRALATGQPDLVSVIKDMAERYEPLEDDEPR